MQNDMPMTTDGSVWKSEVELQYGGRLFPKAEVVISQPWILRPLIEIWYRNGFPAS